MAPPVFEHPNFLQAITDEQLKELKHALEVKHVGMKEIGGLVTQKATAVLEGRPHEQIHHDILKAIEHLPQTSKRIMLEFYEGPESIYRQ